jgi:hypothetical protein
MIGLSQELSIEDWMHEDLVPADPIAFINLQTSFQEIDSLR